jgi:cellulose synthase operon protein C
MASPTAFAATDPQVSRFYEDALSRFEKKDMPGAIIQLKNALKIDNKNLSVQVLLGRALLASNQIVAAEVALDEALRLGVNRAEVVVPLAQSVMGQGKPQPVLDQPRFAEAGLPPGVQAQLQLIKASAAGELGDAKAALKFIEASRALVPGVPDSWLAEVPIRLRAMQIKEAIAAADKAISLAPGSAQALYLRGTIAHVQADQRSTLGYYDQAIKARADHTDALVARAGLLLDMDRLADASRDVAELRKSSASDPRGAYLRALIAERQGEAAVAKSSLNEVTALLDPVPMEFIRYRPQLLILGGLSHYGLGQREKAKPYLEAALRSQPNSPVSKLLAQIYLADNNIDRAIESLDAYLKAHPNDMQATHLLASAHMSQGRHARATSLMQSALRRQDLPALRGLLGLSLVGSGKYGDAVSELENAIKRDPGQLQAGSALAAIYMQSGQAAKAVRVAETLVKHQPNQAGVHNLLGSARAKSGNAAGARSAFEQALKLDPSFLAPSVNLARLDIDAKVYDAALERLNGVLAKDPKHVESMVELARIHQRLGKMADAQRWLEKADDLSGLDNIVAGLALVDLHMANKNSALALEAVKRLTAKAPDSVPVLMTVAKTNMVGGDAAVVKASLSRAATQANYDPQALVEIALLQINSNNLPGAAYSLGKAVAERPDFLPALAMLTEVEIRLGELNKAEPRARQIIANHPKKGVGHALLGDIAAGRNQRPAAIESYRRAHQIDRSTDSLVRLYRALTSTDPTAAASLAEQWLKLHPRDIAARRAMADGHARAGNFAAARAAYEALVKVAPDDAEALNNLANVLLQSNDPGALAYANQALAKKPEAPYIIGTAGWAAFKAGQTDRALQLLRDARLRDPANPDTRYFLSAVLASLGRNGEAKEELKTALQAGQTFAYAKDAEKLLSTLK